MTDKVASGPKNEAGAHGTSPEERAFIEGLAGKSRFARYGAYLRRGGPGYLQSAMTLGGGTAVFSVYAGRMFGYELLWVAPMGMLIGIIMLGVLAKLSLESDERPYRAMAKHAGRPLALAWALGALIASIIWHFPQYALAGAAVSDAADVGGMRIQPAFAAFGVLAIALPMSLLYGRTPRLARIYESIVKVLIVGVIACFALVVLRISGDTDWGAVARGFIPSVPASIEPGPDGTGGLSPWTLIASGLAAAVGINMVLLYPYSLRERGWGKDHVEFARFDLVAGMLLPYIIATTLVIVATAGTIPWEAGGAIQKLKPVDAAQAFGSVLGPTAGRLVFDLGLVGMALSTIALHMVASGFALAEITGAGRGSWTYRMGTLLPIPGVLGPFFWKDLVWLAIPTNIICGLFLPATYIGIILWSKRSKSRVGPLALALMAIATTALTVSLASDLVPKVLPDLFNKP